MGIITDPPNDVQLEEMVRHARRQHIEGEFGPATLLADRVELLVGEVRRLRTANRELERERSLNRALIQNLIGDGKLPTDIHPEIYPELFTMSAEADPSGIKCPNCEEGMLTLESGVRLCPHCEYMEEG